MNVVEILLSRDKELPVREKDVKIKRLSRKGEDVVFSLRSLSYDRVQEIRKIGGDDMSLHILLAGVTAPSLKNEELQAHYGAATPFDLVKAMLTPGEIEDLSSEIERLSGYRVATIENIKKK